MYLTKHPFSRSSCHSSKRSKQTNQTTQAALCYVKRGRENTARPCALARHQRPGALAQRKTRGPPPPRRPITATPPLRPVLDRKAGAEAAHLRLQYGAAPPRQEPSAEAEGTQPRRALGLLPRASSTGQGPATRIQHSGKKGSEVAVALKANSAARHLRRVRHVKAGPVEPRRHGQPHT
jgi:hypothetical protein